MRVLVSGATGFIGRHLVAALSEAGHQVLTLARSPEPPPGSFGHYAGEVDSTEAREWASQAEAVVHLAGLSDASLSLEQPLEFSRVNALGTLNLLEAARQGGGRFILVSTQRIYQPSCIAVDENSLQSPREPYAYSKQVAETWVRMYGQLYDLATMTLRFFSVYGPGQRAGRGASGVVSIFLERALRGEPLVVTGSSCRDFTYVSDAVLGVQLALQGLENGLSGRTFNVATGVGTSLKDLAALVKEVTRSPSPVHVQLGPSETYVADIAAARQLLGFSPRVPLREGLSRYADWYSRCALERAADAGADQG